MTRVDGSRPETLEGVPPPLKRPSGRAGDVQVRRTQEEAHGGMTQVLVLGERILRRGDEETMTLRGRGGVTVTVIKRGAKTKRKKTRRRKTTTTGTQDGEGTHRIGRPHFRTLEDPVHIGLSGGVPKADLLQFPRAPSRSLIRTPSHQLSLSPPKNSPTRTAQEL